MNKPNILINELFLNRPPSWLIRWGMLLVFAFFTLLIIFGFILKYDEVIDAEILVTSENPPVDLFSRNAGKLVYVNFESGKIVNENDILAVIENPSKHEDIFYLKENLKDSLLSIDTLTKLYQNFPSDLELEVDMHSSYQKFLKAFQNYLLYLNLNDGQRESENLNFRVSRIKRQINIKNGQLETAKRNFSLSNQNRERQKTLFDKGVVSRQQLDASEQELLVASNEINRIREELEGLHVDNLDIQDLASKSLNKDIINASKYFSELQLAKQELKGKIDRWEKSYALKSPISGVVTVFDVWNNFQNVENKEHILTIVPLGKNRLLGKCKVPINNSAKLQQGQNVIIKLDNYPYREWGLVNGIVSNVSETPKKGNQSYYSVYVQIPNLRTTFNKEIKFKQEMVGSAKIILKKTSLIERVFYQFRGLWSDMGN
ncbi:MAG: HlyD family efflux transporter periplasmic adaptor subunit [Bacteroidota bacterium]